MKIFAAQSIPTAFSRRALRSDQSSAMLTGNCRAFFFYGGPVFPELKIESST
jgi:hypothetical protein